MGLALCICGTLGKSTGTLGKGTLRTYLSFRVPTNCPSCSTPNSRKAATPSGAVPQVDAANYPGVAAIAAAMNNAMARRKTMPGPVEWCGASFEEMHHDVCLQMVVNGVHLQHKRGAKGLAWKDFYERTVGICTR